MTGKHYGWHRRWVVDLAASTATHDSGLIVRAVRSDNATDFLPVNLDEWQDKMLATMPLPNLAAHARRLMREAAEVYNRARDE